MNNKPLLTRLKEHHDKFSLYAQELPTLKLLLEAITHIEKLTDAIDKMPISKLGCDGVLLVSVEKYNQTVEIINK
jgi:hypothetical protein